MAVSDYLAEVWIQLRRTTRLNALQGRLEWGDQLSGSDRKAAQNTVDGLLRLLCPDSDMEVPDSFLAWAATLALEMRRRVKEAQAFIGTDEFGKVALSFAVGDGPEIVVYCDETVAHRKRMNGDTSDPPGGDTSVSSILPIHAPKDVSSSTQSKDYARATPSAVASESKKSSRRGDSPKSTASATPSRTKNGPSNWPFASAAGYDAVRCEISALRKANHPNIVKVIWADRTEHGERYLIMEHIDGEPLADYATGKKRQSAGLTTLTPRLFVSRMSVRAVRQHGFDHAGTPLLISHIGDQDVGIGIYPERSSLHLSCA